MGTHDELATLRAETGRLREALRWMVRAEYCREMRLRCEKAGRGIDAAAWVAQTDTALAEARKCPEVQELFLGYLRPAPRRNRDEAKCAVNHIEY